MAVMGIGRKELDSRVKFELERGAAPGLAPIAFCARNFRLMSRYPV